jgi:hypothetical protein
LREAALVPWIVLSSLFANCDTDSIESNSSIPKYDYPGSR